MALEPWHFLWTLAAAAGMVSAGLAGSTWALATGKPPRIGMLHRIDSLTPVKVLTLCVYAPLGAVRLGLWYLAHNPLIGIVMLAAGLGWSFLQGVFILTTFFGYT